MGFNPRLATKQATTALPKIQPLTVRTGTLPPLQNRQPTLPAAAIAKLAALPTLAPVTLTRTAAPAKTVTTLRAAIPTEGDMLENEVIVFTGFRDKALENEIGERGGRVTTAISGKTTLVVLKDGAPAQGKVLEAQNRGIPVMNLTDFKFQYDL
jgi:BRCT domain type II-containing protein